MADGHIYPQQRAEAVLDGWFRAGNLSVLRELALLWLAAALASDPQRRHPGVHVPGGGDARERVVVALGGGEEGETLIRRAARIAARSGGVWHEVTASAAAAPASSSGGGGYGY